MEKMTPKEKEAFLEKLKMLKHEEEMHKGVLWVESKNRRGG